MKLWIYRTETPGYLPIADEHFIERCPDKAFVYTKLFMCYDKPCDILCSTTRKTELPKYMFPEIQPGELVEFESGDFIIKSENRK